MNPDNVTSAFWTIEKKAVPPDGGFESHSVMTEQDRQLVWSAHNDDDWEILVYKRGQLWEACFFRWAIHHEHAIGSSFDSVRHRAEQRIHLLEADHLRSTEWRKAIH